MAQWRLFKCENCDYQILTAPAGFYALMSGVYYTFKCSNCKRIIKMGVGGGDNLPECPYCHETSGLSTWNPIEGQCPQCGGKMIEPKRRFFCCAD